MNYSESKDHEVYKKRKKDLVISAPRKIICKHECTHARARTNSRVTLAETPYICGLARGQTCLTRCFKRCLLSANTTAATKVEKV